MFTCYSPVRRSTHSEETFSHDLHVLSTPPAFILSQDQTLHKFYIYSIVCTILLVTHSHTSEFFQRSLLPLPATGDNIINRFCKCKLFFNYFLNQLVTNILLTTYQPKLISILKNCSIPFPVSNAG